MRSTGVLMMMLWVSPGEAVAAEQAGRWSNNLFLKLGVILFHFFLCFLQPGLLPEAVLFEARGGQEFQELAVV